MSTTSNKEVAKRFIEEVFNAGNYHMTDDLLAENFVAHVGGSEHDRAEFTAMIIAYRNGFPDYHCSIDDQIAESDQWSPAGHSMELTTGS